MADIIEVNVETGERIERAYTQEELDAINAAKNDPVKLAQDAQLTKDRDELAQAKADATINYLVTHTPTEINTKVRQLIGAANVTNLATAQASIAAIEDLMVRLSIAVSVTAGRGLR